MKVQTIRIYRRFWTDNQSEQYILTASVRLSQQEAEKLKSKLTELLQETIKKE